MSLLSYVGKAASGAVSTVGNLASKAVGATGVAGTLLGKAAGDVVEKSLGSTYKNLGNLLKLPSLLSTLSGSLGQLAEDAAGAVLPKELQFVKEIVGAAVNLKTGNLRGFLQNALDLLQSLPEITSHLQDIAPNLAPSAPPSAGATASGSSASGSAAAPTSNQQSTASASGSAAAATSNQQSTAASSTAQTGATTQAGSSEGTTESKETKGQAAAKAFLDAHSDPEDFMEQIRNGNIPEDVLNSQAGMMMIQERLQRIQQMNQLMTQMLKSMHDMSMAVVQNVRV